MYLKGYINMAVRLWIIFMAACLVACNTIWSEMPAGGYEEDVPQKVTLNLAISHPDAGIITRASSVYDDLDFTKNEAAVNNLVVFIVDLNEDGSENYSQVVSFEKKIDPIDFINGYYILQHKTQLETGPKHIYVGANMKAEHIYAFLQHKSMTYSGDGQAIEMIMTPDYTHSGLGTGITMFALSNVPETEKTTIDITTDTEDYYLIAELERLSAKVLLTCKEGEPGWVATGATGWVETSEIRYTLNNTNRSTFIDRRASDYNMNIDPNWNISSHITPNANAEGGYSAAAGNTAQFESWSTGELIARLFDDRYSSSPLPYDENRIKTGDVIPENHYVEGLYCLENTSFDDIGIDNASKDAAAMHATTHVVVAVRFIPRKIVGYDLEIKQPTSKEDALNNWLVYPSTSDYQNGTYWVRVDSNGEMVYHNGSPYYGLGAKDKIIAGGAKEEEFICYNGGWSYFTTFVDGTKTSDNKLTYAGHEVWGVQRDNYYILSIQKIGHPGSPIPGDEFMRINSQTTEWVPRGSREIIIKPSGN